MKEIVFANKKDAPHLPLQAADMLAYRIRQIAQNLSDNTFELEELDRILLKNLLQSAAKINPELSRFLR
jgi:flagellar biosynthesis protein FlhB